MRTVRFLADQAFVREGRPTLNYEKGSVHELKDDHAKRWVVRGVAEYVGPEVAPVGMPLVAPVVPATVETQPPAVDAGTTRSVPLPLTTADMKEPAHVDPVASAPAVDGKDGGGTGKRPEHVAGSGARRPLGRPPGSGHK
jgi:hypothetical protein